MSEMTTSARRSRSAPESLTAQAASVHHPLVRALLVLTFTTGLVDASSYLGLGHVFTANQTGNAVLLALGIAATGISRSSRRWFRSARSSWGPPPAG